MRQELQERLINLSLKIETLCKDLNFGFQADHLSKQIIRSATSTALNYAEATAAESKKDFIHKASIVLKELRETKVNLRLLENSIKTKNMNDYEFCNNECDQLVAIFYKTVSTARLNPK